MKALRSKHTTALLGPTHAPKQAVAVVVAVAVFPVAVVAVAVLVFLVVSAGACSSLSSDLCILPSRVPFVLVFWVL